MDIASKEQFFAFRDSSPAAIARRLRAARTTVSKSQKDFAALLNLKATTYNSQETKGTPSMEVLDYLYNFHRIGPNFILLGEFLPLPGDVQIALESALRENDLA